MIDMSQDVGEPLVVARNLGLKGVRGRAYGGVSLSLPAGTAHAICAEDKGGKKELLLTLAGRMLPTEGRLTIAGHDARTLHGLDKVRPLAGLGFFERVNEVERVLRVSTVASAELSLVGKPSGRASTDAFLDRWGLLEHRGSVIDDLPRRDYDLLGIALGMAGDPSILVVGDIERDLTEQQSMGLADLLRDLAHDTGTLVVCGVNDYELATRFDSATCITDDARAQRDAWEGTHQKQEVA